MLKLFKQCFKTTNDCIILATPLIIFLSILSWYTNYALNAADTVSKGILAGVTIVVMFCGLTSAWLYMAKKAIALSKTIVIFDNERKKALLNLLLSLPKGIGRLFLPILGTALIYFILYSILISGISFVVGRFIGAVDLSSIDIDSLQLSSKEIFEEISQMSRRELAIINLWNILFCTGSAIISFITMLWVPEIVYAKTPFYKSLAKSTVKVFHDFKKSLILYIYIVFLIIVITVLNTVLMINPFLYFFVLILYYYFLVYIVVLLFTYYEQNYIKNN